MKAGAADTDERRTAHLPDGGSSGIVRNAAQFPGTTHGLDPRAYVELGEELAQMIANAGHGSPERRGGGNPVTFQRQLPQHDFGERRRHGIERAITTTQRPTPETWS